MTLLVLSFLAGVLTVAAPCTLTLLPVIVGGSLARTEEKDDRRNLLRPLVIVTSLALSVVVFTLLLKYSTSLLGVDAMVWQIIAGLIILAVGATFLIPGIWEKVALKTGLHESSNRLLGESFRKGGFGGDVMIGASLGPVFSGCSPTYAFVVASILPISFAEGLVYLLAYTIGLAGMLLVVAYAGQGLVRKLGWLSDSRGTFRRVVGLLFIIVGLAVATGYDKKAETWVIDRGLYDPISNLEQRLRN